MSGLVSEHPGPADVRPTAPGQPVRARLVSWLRGEPIGVPTHALLAHVPTALLPTSLLFDLLVLSGIAPALGPATAPLIALGLIGGLAAGGAGLLDWAEMLPGPRRDRVNRHLTIQLAALAVFAVSFAIRIAQGGTPGLAVLVSAVGTVLLLLGGHRGALLVYRDGMRVRTSRH